MTYAASAAQHMIESQILTGAMLNPGVLDAMASVNRSLFVPQSLRDSAYVDSELPVGEGRYLMEPLVLTRMVEVAGIRKTDTVLTIAAATGYICAVLSKLAAKVIGIESKPHLAALARKNLVTSNIENATIIGAPLTDGFFPASPYDVIFIEGCSEYIPQAYTDQLKEGGKIVTLENLAKNFDGGRMGKIVLYIKTEGLLSRKELYDGAAPVINELKMPEKFTF